MVHRGVRRRLPVGLQTLAKLRGPGADCYYVDKTAFLRRMVGEGSHYFLSRPRRFGKSLLVDTIRELFEGNRNLFAGLAIEPHWDWGAPRAVVLLDFAAGDYGQPGFLERSVTAQLAAREEAAGLAPCETDPSIRLSNLIRRLREQTGRRVVVLVDEYDRPILDPLIEGGGPRSARRETALANRNFLRGLYSVVKESDRHIRFSFLTGVSRFSPGASRSSNVSLFSGLNNLEDITLAPEYSAICGCTEDEIDAVFAPELVGLDREAIRDWYNGYCWRGPERVYNPFGLLKLFRSREFGSHWFETGSPAFLVETLVRRRFAAPELEGLVVNDADLAAFDVEHISARALLFQTSYLTIREERMDRVGRREYVLGYPNREVRTGLNQSLLRFMAGNPAQGRAPEARALDLLEARDADGLRRLFHAFYASIPHQWLQHGDIANYEGYYAGLFFTYFTALNVPLAAKENTNRGRLDMSARFAGRVFVFEFKVVERAGEVAVMAQLRERRYADRYRGLEEPVHLVAVEFSRERRNVVRIEIEDA